MATEIKKVMCHGCGVGYCGILVHVEDGKIGKVTGNPDHPAQNPPYCGRGFFVEDGKPYRDLHYNPARLNYPMKRVGERGSGKWERITWDQGLDEVSDKLHGLMDKYGPETLYVSTGTAHMTDYTWTPWRFCNPIKAPNKNGHEQVCYGPMVVTNEISYGWATSISPVPNIGCMIIAMNITESLPMLFPAVRQAAKSGTKVVTIDPRMTETARISDLWLQVRPGTDVALLLSWIRMVIKDRLYDRDYVTNWTNAPFLVRTDTNKTLREKDIVAGGQVERFVVWDGAGGRPAVWDPDVRAFTKKDVAPTLDGKFDVTLADGSRVECKTVWTLLTERVEPYTFELAEKITTISSTKLKLAGEWYATLKPSQLVFGGHVHDSFAPGSIDAIRCSCILRAITGNLDTVEMVAGPLYPDRFVTDYEMELKTDEAMPAEQKKKQIGGERFRLLSFQGYDLKSKYQKKLYGVATNAQWSCQGHPPMYWRAMLSGKPYPITAMIIAGSNPLNKYTNTRMVYDAMKKLELIVTCDLFETPTAAMSDYLFPMSDFLERPSFNVGFGGIQPFLWAGERAVKREHERRDDYDFWRGLAIRFGQEKYWPWKTLEEVYDYRVKPASGFKSFQELVDKEPFVFMESKLKGYADLDSKTGHPRGYATPSGRVELWSIILEELGYDRLPQFKEPFISPVSRPMLAKEYPMTLISIARHMPFHHSEFYPVPSLRGMHPDPLVEIHPVTARMMSPPINNGDWVWIETPRGKIKQRATLSWGIDPQWVCVEHCWWFPEQSGADPTLHGVWQSNVNVLTEDDPDLCDPVFGTYPIATSLCRIRKCEEQ